MDHSLYPRPGECLRCYRTIFATLPVRPNRAYPTQMLQNSTDDEEGKEASGFTRTPMQDKHRNLSSNGFRCFFVRFEKNRWPVRHLAVPARSRCTLLSLLLLGGGGREALGG